MSVQSRVYVKVRVSHANFDPTQDAVHMAFTAEDAEPEDTDWQDADWQPNGPPYMARCLVGPEGTIELPVGFYAVWVKITDTPEAPVERAGWLTIV